MSQDRCVILNTMLTSTVHKEFTFSTLPPRILSYDDNRGGSKRTFTVIVR